MAVLHFCGDAISATADPTDRSIKDFVIPAAFKDILSVGTMVTGGGQQFLDERESTYSAEAINTIKNNTPFQNLWYTRLIFDRLVTAELQDTVDPNYRDKKQARLEKLGNGFWWDMNNDEIRLPEVASKDQ